MDFCSNIALAAKMLNRNGIFRFGANHERHFVGFRSRRLALFGELDNNILAEENKAAWESALKAGGNRDYTLLILPKANRLLFEAKVGSNREMSSAAMPAHFFRAAGGVRAAARLLLQPYATEQVLEPLVGAQRIETRT